MEAIYIILGGLIIVGTFLAVHFNRQSRTNK